MSINTDDVIKCGWCRQQRSASAFNPKELSCEIKFKVCLSCEEYLNQRKISPEEVIQCSWCRQTRSITEFESDVKDKKYKICLPCKKRLDDRKNAPKVCRHGEPSGTYCGSCRYDGQEALRKAMEYQDLINSLA